MSNQPKRVLIFSFVYYPRFIGGAEIAIKEITDRMNPSEIEFDLMALRLDNKLPIFEKIGNVNVYRVGFACTQKDSADSLPWYLHINKYLYPVLACIKASRLHAKRKYNATWGIMANYSGFGALFFKFFHKSVPFILTLQEGDPIDYIKQRTRFVSPVFKSIFTHADRIQTISNYLADFGREMGAKCSIEVIPNGVDVSLFTKEYAKSDLEKIRKDLEIPNDAPVLITTSRLVVKNAVADIIKSLEYIPEAYFLVLGTGYQEIELKELASDVGVSDRIKFLGYVPHTDMPKYLKASDIFIRPSLSEGFGNSFIEAMATRIPVIATPVGGIIDFLRDKETGLFCEVNSPEDIARKTEIYLHDKNLRDEIVDNAFDMVVRQYDWKLVAKNMKEKVFDMAFDILIS
ncbi:MAG: glycosyltransferase family 4 protein [Patescibacteria group bacterium]